jgi:hypothetical protein
VLCEISDPDYALRLFADPAAEERGWTASFQHRMVGKMKLGGLTFDLSGTPATLRGGPLWPGQDSKSTPRRRPPLAELVVVSGGIAGLSYLARNVGPRRPDGTSRRRARC